MVRLKFHGFKVTKIYVNILPQERKCRKQKTVIPDIRYIYGTIIQALCIVLFNRRSLQVFILRF